MYPMLQDGDENDDEPRFHGDTKHSDKHDGKPENMSSYKYVILTVFLIIVIVAVLLGAYYYRHLWFKGRTLDFR